MSLADNKWEPGMVVRKDSKSGGKPYRYRVLDPTHTFRGKLRLERLHTNNPTLLTTWWRTPSALPKGFYVEGGDE
jgi:hypothetical protein